MKILERVIDIGLNREFTFYHFSDTHLTRADDRENERKLKLAADRARYFDEAEDCYRKLTELAEDSFLVGTGDLTDFVSAACLDAAKELSDRADMLYAAGNHEFSLYVGEAFEDEAYRNQSLERVQAAFRNNIRMDAVVRGGVRFVALDNSYYFLDRTQLDYLKEQVSYGEPVVLCMHTPLYEPEMARREIEVKKNPCAYLMAAPEELLETYSDYRRRQQTPDAVTREAYDYILSEPRIACILAGHIHSDEVCPLNEHLTQYTVGCTTLAKVTLR